MFFANSYFATNYFDPNYFYNVDEDAETNVTVLLSNGHFKVGNITSNGEILVSRFTQTGDFLISISTTPETPFYLIITYTEDIEMFQKSGTSKAHPVQVLSTSTGAPVLSLTNVTACYRLNGGAETVWTPLPTITAYSTNMGTYLVTVPTGLDGVTFSAYDTLEIAILADGAKGNAMIVFMPDPSVFASASSISDIKGTNWTDETLVTIQAAAETGGSSTGGGSEIILTGYTHDATAQTLTITDTNYQDVKIEQIKEIWNLSKHCLLYDYKNPSANASDDHEIAIQLSEPGVIHYDYYTTTKADEDKIMIVVFAASA